MCVEGVRTQEWEVKQTSKKEEEGETRNGEYRRQIESEGSIREKQYKRAHKNNEESWRERGQIDQVRIYKIYFKFQFDKALTSKRS